MPSRFLLLRAGPILVAVLALAGPPALAAPGAKRTGEMRVSLPEGPLAGSTVDAVPEP